MGTSSAAPAFLPAGSPAAGPGGPSASPVFTALMESLLDEGDSRPAPSIAIRQTSEKKPGAANETSTGEQLSSKSQAGADANLLQNPGVQVPANQAVVLPSVLQINLQLSTATSPAENPNAETQILAEASAPPSSSLMPGAQSKLMPVKTARAQSTPTEPSKGPAHAAAPLAQTSQQPVVWQQMPPEKQAQQADAKPSNNASAQASFNSEPPVTRVQAADAKSSATTELAFAARLTQSHAAADPNSSMAVSKPAEAPSSMGQQTQDQGTSDDTGQTPQFTKPAREMGTKPELQLNQPEHSAARAPDGEAALQTAPQSAAPFVPGISQPSAAAAAAHPDRSSEAQPAPALPLPEPPSVSKSEPVRDLAFKVGVNPSDQVQLKVQERGGEVLVSVHSANPELTSDLRQQLGDLAGKLDRAGYHSEIYKPSNSPGSTQVSEQASTGQQQDLSGRQQRQDQQQESGRQKKSSQPKWLQEMNTSFGPAALEGVQPQ